MAYYNNGFPATYPQMYQQPVIQQPLMQPQPQQYQVAQQQNTGGITIVQIQGEAAAKSYLVSPNTTVQLWDVESGVIYIKSADASGMPSMKVLDYTIRGESEAKAPASGVQYATKDELNALADKVRDIRDEISDLTSKRRASRLTKEEEQHE